MHHLLKSLPSDLGAQEILPLWNTAVADAWLGQMGFCLSENNVEAKRPKGGEYNNDE